MTDDVEAQLRRRLTDLAESADRDRPWEDPLIAARTAAATPTDDAAGTVVPLAGPGRRRWLPAAAVAAVVVALVAGGGFGLRELVRGSGSGSSGSAAVAGGAASTGDAAEGGVTSGGAAPGGSRPQAGAGPTGGCDVLAAATSTGPLAQIATIRSSGTVAPRTTPGGAVGVTYQLTFGQAGGTAQVRAASALLVRDGSLCTATGAAQPGVIEVVPVSPGPGQSGTATFAAVDSRGEPLPAGDYQLAVVIPYSVDGSALAQLVSPPVTVTVAAS